MSNYYRNTRPTVMRAKRGPIRDRAGVAAQLAECIRAGMYDGTPIGRRIAAAGALDSPEWVEAIAQEADGMICRELVQWEANEGTRAEWESLPNVPMRRKATGARGSRGLKAVPPRLAPVRVVLRPMAAGVWEAFRETGDVPGWVPAKDRGAAKRLCKDRARIESDPGYMVRHYPEEPRMIGMYHDPANQREQRERVNAACVEWRKACEELDAWREGAADDRPDPAPDPIDSPLDPAVIVAETVREDAPAPVPVAALPADAGPTDSPRDPAGEGDPVADYLARLIHAPKRAFAEALIRGENPPDPGRPWAAKVRRTLARYGAI